MMCWILHTATYQPELIKFLLWKDFITVQYNVFCTSSSCILNNYNQHKVCSQVTNVCLQFSWWCWTRLWKLLSMCTLCCGLMRQKKWCTQSTQPACMGNGESSCFSLHLIAAKI
jgi:hypothetical protein